MSKIRKLIALILCGSSLLGCTACGGGKQQTGGSGVIQISCWEAGWGSEWLYAMAERFEDLNPQYTVEIDASSADGSIKNLLPVPDNNPYEVIFGGNSDPTLYSSYANLNDVMTSKYKDEAKTIEEKIGKEYCEVLKNREGDYDRLFFGTGYYGIIYNGDIFEAHDYEVPKTTNEMVALIETMKVDEVVPFIHFVNGGYWHGMLWTWAMQYVGHEEFYEMCKAPTLESLTDDENGISQALDVIYQMVGDKDNYMQGSSGFDFTTSQSLFLAPSSRSGKEIAMMVNGSWLENEMKNSEDELNQNMLIMKTPVLSSIIGKCSTIKDDETLAKVIEAVDRGKTSFAGISSEDFELIKKARLVEVSNADGNQICVPYYSDNIEGAKDFVRFFYSDEGLKIWAEKTQIMPLANFDDASIKIDTSTFSSFEKSQIEFAKKSRPVCEGYTNARHQIFISGGASLTAGFNNAGYVSSMMNYPPKTSAEIWSGIKTNIQENWAGYWANAGLELPQ